MTQHIDHEDPVLRALVLHPVRSQLANARDPQARLEEATGLALALDLDVGIATAIKRWATEDFEGAWAWVTTCTSQGLSNYVTAGLLEALVETDPDRALKLDCMAYQADSINFDMLPDSLLESWQISRGELDELRKARD